MANADNLQDPLRGLRILLVEDDPLICFDLEASLADLGATVTAATTVAEALKAMAASDLDFAVLDFELGAETSEPIAIMAKARHVPFLYLSGYSAHDERFGNWPGIQILAKPLSVGAIARAIQETLGKSR